MAVSSINSWGYEKIRTPAWFFPAPWQNPFFQFFHSITHHGAFKKTQIISKHWWTDFYKTAKTLFDQCLTCQVHDPGKTIFALRGLKSPSSGLFEQLQLNFIQSPPNMGLALCSHHCTCIFWMGQSIPLPQGWCPHSGKETVRKHVSHSAHTSCNLQWLRRPPHWANQISLNESLTNFSKLSPSLSPSRWHQENLRKWMGFHLKILLTLNLLDLLDSVDLWCCLWPYSSQNDLWAKLAAHEIITSRPVSVGV